MNPNEEKSNFLDRNTILAFALILMFWLGWSKYMESQTPPAPAETATVATATNEATRVDSNAAAQGTVGAVGGAAGVSTEPATAPVTEKTLVYDSANWAFEISSRGMGLRNVNVKAFQTRTGEPIILGAVTTNLPFATGLVDGAAALDFNVEKTDEKTFVGTAVVNGTEVRKTMKVNDATYTIDTTVEVVGAGENFRGVTIALSDVLNEGAPGGIFTPSYDYQEWFVRHEDTKTRTIIDKSSGVSVVHPNTTIAALTAHYFALAAIDRSELIPRFEAVVPANSETATGRLVYQPASRIDNLRINYVAFAGPKRFELLNAVDDNLSQVIDFGMFAVVAKPILLLLKFLQTGIGNWGWAIVVLTIIVRLIVLPFNVYSYKSMKVMQKIQPEMNRIREKYKDKPAEEKMKMNQEIMDLMKRSKANPLGGCLPMLLQLPVFIALYQVLGQSIELYRAPYIFWITDLSLKDPFYVLPVLMGITMFVQQKITPTTMDPQQAKILVWMPVIFSFFMLSLPSGLTLYIFISTLFGIIQQYVFMRDKSALPSVKEAKA